MLKQTLITQTLGKTFADALDERIIDAGALQFSRRDMVETLVCPNFNAAGRLNKILRRHHIQTAAQLHKTSPYDLARIKGVGMTCLFVAMCILDHAQYDVAKWWGWNQTNVVKFSTFKANAVARAKKRVA